MSRIGGSFSRSWRLISASWSVVRAEPSLMVYPTLAIPVTLLLLALMVLGMGTAVGWSDAEPSTPRLIAGIAVVAIGFLAMSFVTVFFNTALAAAALMRLRGEDPTLGDGFRVARSRLRQIAGYSVISAVVGAILSKLQDSGLFGTIAAALGGLAWGLATALVMPVLAAEGLGPVDAIRRSSGLLKRSFGEQVAGGVTIGAILGVPMLIVGLIGGLLVWLGSSTGSDAATAVGIGILVAGFGILVLLGLTVFAALQQVFYAAVYEWAADNRTSPYFTDDQLRAAFVAK